MEFTQQTNNDQMDIIRDAFYRNRYVTKGIAKLPSKVFYLDFLTIINFLKVRY